MRRARSRRPCRPRSADLPRRSSSPSLWGDSPPCSGCGKSPRPSTSRRLPRALGPGRPGVEERRLADRGGAQGRARGLAPSLAGGAPRPRPLPRRPGPAGPGQREGGERPGAGRGGRAPRRPEAAARPGALSWRRDLRGLEGLPRRPGGPRLGTAAGCVIDGHPGLRKAVELVRPRALGPRGCHTRRHLERQAPKHALAELRGDAHRIVHAESAAAARATFAAFERTWTPRCPGVVRSLQEGGAELLPCCRFPRRPGTRLRTTPGIERLHEECRRRVETPGALPTEDAALVLRVGLGVSGPIRLRRLAGWRHIPARARAPPVGGMTHRALAPGSRWTGRPISGYPQPSVLPRIPDPRFAATSSPHRKGRPRICHVKRDTAPTPGELV